MNLTSSQLTTLKNDIAADNTLNSFPNSSDGADAIRMLYDLLPGTDYFVWKSGVAKSVITSDPAFDWTRVDNMTVGKARIWTEMFDNPLRTVNPSQANVRSGFSAIFTAAGDIATLTSITSNCRRKATRVEKLFATGSGTTGSPSIMSFEGTLDINDIITARNS